MTSSKQETFGNLGPWAEPSWYSSLASPYYNASHKKLRNTIRAYVDEHIKPHMLSWEEAGEAPHSERLKWAQTGFSFTDIPTPYRPSSVPGPAGIPVDQLDVFHMMIMTDEMSRIEGGVVTSLEGASVIGVPPIVHYGTEEQKRKWLPGLFSWETSFCLGITEPGGGVCSALFYSLWYLLLLVLVLLDFHVTKAPHSLTSPTCKPRLPKPLTENPTLSTATRNGSPAYHGPHT